MENLSRMSTAEEVTTPRPQIVQHKLLALLNGMMFQAETLSLRAADGIGGANPRPTDLS